MISWMAVEVWINKSLKNTCKFYLLRNNRVTQLFYAFFYK